MTNIAHPTRNLELDALRGIAALMVVFFHFSLGRDQATVGLVYGKTGVDLFFIISGFVIFKSIQNTQALPFLMKRFCRLYPAYWVVLTFTFILTIILPYYKEGHWNPIPWNQYWANMTMFQYYLKVPNLDGPYWSLIVEMNFYLFVFLVLLFRRLKYLSLFLLFFTVSTAILFYFKDEHSLFNRILFFLPVTEYLPLFLAGMTFYKIHESKEIQRVNYWILGVSFVLSIYFLKWHYSNGKDFLNFYEHAVAHSLYFFIFFLLVRNQLKFIVNRITLFLGKISFATYLIHQFLSIYFILPYALDDLHLNFWVASLLLALPVVLILASLVTYLVEIPISRWLRGKMS